MHNQRPHLTHRENFELFVTRVDDLSGMRIISNQGLLMSGWSVSLKNGQAAMFSATKPDEEDLRSYLLAFRKFTLKNEPTNVEFVHGLCNKYFRNDVLKGHIRECQQGWKDLCTRGRIKLNINGNAVSPEHIADLVINGHYFHDDFEKTEELNLYNSHSTILVKQEFISFVADATRIIARTGHTIKTALREGAVKT